MLLCNASVSVLSPYLPACCTPCPPPYHHVCRQLYVVGRSLPSATFPHFDNGEKEKKAGRLEKESGLEEPTHTHTHTPTVRHGVLYCVCCDERKVGRILEGEQEKEAGGEGERVSRGALVLLAFHTNLLLHALLDSVLFMRFVVHGQWEMSSAPSTASLLLTACTCDGEENDYENNDLLSSPSPF